VSALYRVIKKKTESFVWEKAGAFRGHGTKKTNIELKYNIQ
jgi:hypothetical protein